MDYGAAIRQQAEDLQDELKDLSLWQEEVTRQREANRGAKLRGGLSNNVPPIRGTVPSLKNAVASTAGVVDNEDPVKAQKDKGNELFQNEKYQGAVEAYTTGINIAPEGPVAHVLYGNRALCYLRLGEWMNAERDASSCVRLNRTYSKGYYRRAIARKQLGNLKGARTDLEAVLALSPNDVSAINEMTLVTKMIQTEREGTVQAPRKRIVITEVDDEDDEQCVKGNIEHHMSSPEAVEDHRGLQSDVVKREVVRHEIVELERARAAQREMQQANQKEVDAKSQCKRRVSSRVEVVEEADEGSKRTSEGSSLAMAQGGAAVPPTVSETPLEEGPSASVSASAQRPGATGERVPEGFIAPRQLKVVPKWTKETLKPPKSFTEFERVFADLKNDEDLLCFYVSVIPPGGMQALFGSNMTPDILFGLLRAARGLPGALVVSFLKGLCMVKRVRDISLFFDGAEKKAVEELLDVVASCGASQEDVSAFRRQLGVV